jgi:hypothetical protein
MQVLTKNSSHIPVSVDCNINIKCNITNIKCLGIMVDNTLTWKIHIEMITQNEVWLVLYLEPLNPLSCRIP